MIKPAYKTRSFSFIYTRIMINLCLAIVISACNSTTSENVKKDIPQEPVIDNVTVEITTQPSTLENKEINNSSISNTSEIKTEKINTVEENKIESEVLNGISPKESNNIIVIADEGRTMHQRGENAVKEQNIFYDKDNDAYSILQKANESLADFPVNRVGEVDWMKALKKELISPRSSLTGKIERPLKDNDIIMQDTKEMSFVRFPHKTHTYWLDCSNCHNKIFVPEANANPINMDKIFRGEYCGVCHNKVAFTTYMCEMCHSVN